MYTWEIEELLKKRDYIIKKAEEIEKLIDVNVNTQIKEVHFNPKGNNYTLVIDNKYDGKRIFEFHVFTVEEYCEECENLILSYKTK